MNDVSLLRLYVLRAMYLLIVVGLAVVVWPGILHRDKPWELMEGVVACMLGAFSLLSLLGLRYPLQMLPVLMWELVWKALWLGLVAYPLWSAGRLEGGTAAVAAQCLGAAIIPFVIPWRYVAKRYAVQKSDRWR